MGGENVYIDLKLSVKVRLDDEEWPLKQLYAYFEKMMKRKVLKTATVVMGSCDEIMVTFGPPDPGQPLLDQSVLEGSFNVRDGDCWREVVVRLKRDEVTGLPLAPQVVTEYLEDESAANQPCTSYSAFAPTFITAPKEEKEPLAVIIIKDEDDEEQPGGVPSVLSQAESSFSCQLPSDDLDVPKEPDYSVYDFVDDGALEHATRIPDAPAPTATSGDKAGRLATVVETVAHGQSSGTQLPASLRLKNFVIELPKFFATQKRPPGRPPKSGSKAKTQPRKRRAKARKSIASLPSTSTARPEIVEESLDQAAWGNLDDYDEGATCPVCSVPWYRCPQSMICCDRCDVWHHYSCVGLTAAPPKSERWFCDRCKKTDVNIGDGKLIERCLSQIH